MDVLSSKGKWRGLEAETNNQKEKRGERNDKLIGNFDGRVQRLDPLCV